MTKSGALLIATGILASEGKSPLFPPVSTPTPYPPLSLSRGWNHPVICEHLTLFPMFTEDPVFSHPITCQSPLESPCCLWYSRPPPWPIFFLVGIPANDRHDWMRRSEEWPEPPHSEVLLCNLGGFIRKAKLKTERFHGILTILQAQQEVRRHLGIGSQSDHNVSMVSWLLIC